MEDENLIYEREKLRRTKETLKEVKSGEEIRLKNLPRMYSNNPRLLANLMSVTATKISNVDKVYLKPYFARIDFKESNRETEKLYIGKIGVLDLDGKVVITDWRAPISSLYYDANLGAVSYDSPSGIIKGNLDLKRQIIIEESELINIFDVDTVSDDELLKPYLGANADSRLKNIVASIQGEQNAIIRKSINKDIIIQGVAGSGKTTVALHRIAYLIYNHSKKYFPNQFMVIGPNKFFINYISNVLPDLDAKNAMQYTFEELAKKFIKESFCVEDSTKKLADILAGSTEENIHKYKNSIEYCLEIDSYLEKFEEEFLSNLEFKIDDIVIISNEIIINTFKEALGECINDKLEMTANILSSRIANDYTIEQKIKKHYDISYKEESDIKKKNEIYNHQIAVEKEQKKGFQKELKKSLSIEKIKVVEIYKDYINSINNSELKEYTLNSFKNKMFSFEDIPALMYIKLKLFGVSDFKEYRHIVIDEAQDFGSFNFYVLKKIMKNATFSIFGDITQGIYSYRSIDDWNEIKDNIFKNIEISKLEKSYRTSIEIMQEANKISKKLGLGEGKPVIRSSGPVLKTRINGEDKYKYIENRLNEFKNMGYKSIAIICKDQYKIDELYKYFKKSNIDIKLIYKDQESYEGGTCLVTSYLSKGLEFDAVIITDADEKNYSSENTVHLKLLYVSMTRALHTLEIIYEDEINKCLK